MTNTLNHLIKGLNHAQINRLINEIPEELIPQTLQLLGTTNHLPETPLNQATTTDTGFRTRPHLTHISHALTTALHNIENGHNQRLIIELPPRSGKTTLTTLHTPSWILRKHPDWKTVLVSHDATLTTSWGRQIRRWAETGDLTPAQIAPDAGAAGEWETTLGGGVLSRSIRSSLTGRGAKILIIDDPHRDFVEAHSATERQRVWDWWLSVAQTRLEPPSLVCVVMTRWHEDDLVGRLLSTDYEGDPEDWVRIRIPALADSPDDPLGREPGQPLLSPLLDETTDQATDRINATRSTVGTYVFSALYQQRPAPASGAIFQPEWWRYWTSDPGKVTPDGRITYLDPDDHTGNWCESWDMAFKGTDTSDYVVGQRWVRRGPDRFLTAQTRGRWTFTQTLDHARSFSAPWVTTRLVEDKANGTAILDSLRTTIDGLIPINPRDSKEARYRAITPEIEAGNIYLPHPTEHPWVHDLLSELRDAPHGAHDDQADALTQALLRLRTQTGVIRHNPAKSARRIGPRGMGGARHAV